MHNFIAYINGPTGIGKTTVANSLSTHFKKGVVVDIDVVKHFIKTGVLGEQITYTEEIISTQKNGEHASYYQMLAEITCDIAERFYKQGYTVVISDMMWENWIVEIYEKRLSQYKYKHFMLEMSKELHENRLKERTRKERVMQDFAKKNIHEKMLAAEITHNSIVITDEELMGRLNAFTTAMKKIDRSICQPVLIDNMSVEDICQCIISYFSQKESSQ